MKIGGKDLREYKNVDNLAEAMENTLDEVVLKLQKFALRVFETEVYQGKTEKFLMTSAYLNAIGAINKEYDTNYSAHIDKIKAHFKKPVKD